MPTDRRVGILDFPEVEVLDFCGPFEVLSATRRDEDRKRGEPSPYVVILVAERPGVVVATGGLKVVPDHDLDDCPTLDLPVVPGGWGTRRERTNERLVACIAERSKSISTLASDCTGSLLLGKAGLLDGRRATTHRKVLDEMRALFPDVAVVDDEHVVEDGDVLTSAGISAGIDPSGPQEVEVMRLVRAMKRAAGRAPAKGLSQQAWTKAQQIRKPHGPLRLDLKAANVYRTGEPPSSLKSMRRRSSRAPVRLIVARSEKSGRLIARSGGGTSAWAGLASRSEALAD